MFATFLHVWGFFQFCCVLHFEIFVYEYFLFLVGDEYVLTNDTSLHLRRPTTSESADIKQSFTMQNNNENKSAGCTTAMFVYFCNSFHINATIIKWEAICVQITGISSNGNLNKNRLNGVKNMSIRNRRLIVLLLILILIIIGSFTSIYRIFSRYVYHVNILKIRSTGEKFTIPPLNK